MAKVSENFSLFFDEVNSAYSKSRAPFGTSKVPFSVLPLRDWRGGESAGQKLQELSADEVSCEPQRSRVSKFHIPCMSPTPSN